MTKQATEGQPGAVKEKARFVYVGQRFWYTEGKCHHTYIREGETNPEKVSALSVPLGSRKSGSDVIGGIYEGEISTSETGMVFHGVSAWKYQGTIQDEAKRIQWRAEHEAARHSLRASKEERSAKDEDLFACLDPIVRAYARTNTDGRRYLLARVIQYIESTSRKAR